MYCVCDCVQDDTVLQVTYLHWTRLGVVAATIKTFWVIDKQTLGVAERSIVVGDWHRPRVVSLRGLWMSWWQRHHTRQSGIRHYRLGIREIRRLNSLCFLYSTTFLYRVCLFMLFILEKMLVHKLKIADRPNSRCNVPDHNQPAWRLLHAYTRDLCGSIKCTYYPYTRSNILRLSSFHNNVCQCVRLPVHQSVTMLWY